MSSVSKVKDSDAWLIVGKVVGAQGLKGELRINPKSEFPERFTTPGKRWIQEKKEEPREIKLMSGRQLPGKSIYVIRILGIDNRSKAINLIGQKLLVKEGTRPNLSEGEFHFLDLLGLEARLTNQGPKIGKVTDLTKAGNDLIEIELLEGKKVLIPFVKSIVPEVQLHEGWLRIDPPPGLLEL